MKDGILTILAIAFALDTMAQKQIAVQSGSSVTFFDQDDLQAALDAAQDGDVVNLPGGTFTGPFTLDRSIQLIGAGYYPDSTSATTATTLTGSFFITEGSSGSFISGINFSSSVTAPSNTDPIIIGLTFHRCQIQSTFGNGSTSVFSNISRDIIFNESILYSIHPSNAKNVQIRNCIVESQVSNIRDGMIRQSVFLGLGGGGISNCSGCSIQGNIFASSNITITSSGQSNSTVSQNVFVDATPSFVSCTEFDNVVGADPAQVFENSINTSYEHTDDFRLIAGGPAIGAGPNGTDCGIFGGPSPWKEGGVPYNPHIQEQFIGTSTNVQGELPVQVKVTAQGN